MKELKIEGKFQDYTFNDEDVKELSKWSLHDLTEAIKTIEKYIRKQEEFLDKNSNCYFREGELYKIINLREYKLADIINNNSGKREYSDKQIKDIKNLIQSLRYHKVRRNLLMLAKLRKILGEAFFKSTSEKRENFTKEVKGYCIKHNIKKYIRPTETELDELEKYLYEKGYENFKGNKLNVALKRCDRAISREDERKKKTL